MEQLESIRADLSQLTPDELAAFRFILDRLLIQGRRSYKPWVAAEETRDMVKEQAEEEGDKWVYGGFDSVLKHVRKQRLIEEFKSAACDHWNALVEMDVCAGCGTDIAADFPDEPTREFSRKAHSNTDGEAALEPCPDCEGWLQRHGAGCPYTVVVPATEVA